MSMRKEIEIKDLPLTPLGALPARKSLGQHVFENLKHAIIRGNILPGDRLVESRIAEALDISRTPVREAIHKLEREGLLRKLPRGGFTVLNLTREDIEETFGIRCVLESYAARLAALNHREEELEPLEERIKEFQICLENGRMDELPRINTEFHNLFYALSRSPKLIKLINDLRDQIYRFRKIILSMNNTARTSNEDHKKMLEAIKNRDVKRVERLVKEHILRGQKIVLEAFERRRGDH
ncbi:MAG: GntR family transcriptional regulator [Desulfobacteraceae bacterium]|jgi:DNA-binding GntR family transcriptional regulator